MLRIIALTIVLPILIACQDSAICVTEEIAPGIFVDAKIDTSVKSFRLGEVKVRGDIGVENSSDQTIDYSNGRLWLIVEQEVSLRPYVDSIASQIVDSGSVAILPDDNLQLSIYWVLRETIGRSLDGLSMTLELAIP